MQVDAPALVLRAMATAPVYRQVIDRSLQTALSHALIQLGCLTFTNLSLTVFAFRPLIERASRMPQRATRLERLLSAHFEYGAIVETALLFHLEKSLPLKALVRDDTWSQISLLEEFDPVHMGLIDPADLKLLLFNLCLALESRPCSTLLGHHLTDQVTGVCILHNQFGRIGVNSLLARLIKVLHCIQRRCR